MRIIRLSPDEFSGIYTAPHVFDTVDFARLNSAKAESIHYLSIADTKHRFGIILGECGGWLRSPFSAPFGGFMQNGGTHGLEHMEEAVGLLLDYARSKGLHTAVTLPPLVYDESQLSKWAGVMMRSMDVRCVDLNYHFDLARTDDYERHIDRSARKNLHQSLKENFRMVRLDSGDRSQVARAYDVIRRNREERGFPLRMTLEQVWQTVSRVVRADFFVLEHEGCDVAAAQVFHVADGIAQVVYWGDIRQYSALRPMNFLTSSLFSHYRAEGLRTLDIGPSTECGIPNYGLCKFKENIGCSVTLKYSFEK